MSVFPKQLISVATRDGRDANTTSCVFRNCFAVSGEETTTAPIWPSCRCINPPYLVARFLRMRGAGAEAARRCKFPITGSFHGPGGRLVFALLLLLNTNTNTNTKQETRKMIEKKSMSMRKGFGYKDRSFTFMSIGVSVFIREILPPKLISCHVMS